MRTSLTAILLVLLCCAGLARQEPAPRERAAQAVNELGQILKQLLSEELKRGGPAAAVAACAESAQTVTTEFAKERGVDLRRVSLKYRNPKDQPDEWEAAKLREWEKLSASGGKLPEEFVQEVTENNRRYLRYLKPILVQPMCLACHGEGEQISPEVREVLAGSYPRDRATGYRTGSLRGAFTAILPVR
jgi:hypothetical protein